MAIALQPLPRPSSNLTRAGYDPETQTLQVEFAGNPARVGEYSGVPPEKHDALLRAPSHGQFFAAEIRNAYPYTPISP